MCTLFEVIVGLEARALTFEEIQSSLGILIGWN
jgi:hypothetical protein